MSTVDYPKSHSYYEMSNDFQFLSEKDTEKFNNRYQFSEFLARKYICAMIHPFAFGKLFIGTKHICFEFFKILHKTPIVIEWNKINGVTQTDSSTIEITTSDGRIYMLYTRAKTNRINRELHLFWKRNTVFEGETNQTKHFKMEFKPTPSVSVLNVLFQNSSKKPSQLLIEEPLDFVLTTATFNELPQNIFKKFFLDEGLFTQFFKSLNHRDVLTNGWKSDIRYGEILELYYKAISKLTHLEANVKELWQIVYAEQSNGIELQVVVNVTDVPYSSYFRTEMVIKLKEVDGKCSFSTHFNVKFFKSTIWKSKIQQTSTKEYLERFEKFVLFIESNIGQNDKELTPNKLEIEIPSKEVESERVVVSRNINKDLTINNYYFLLASMLLMTYLILNKLLSK
ncbi:VASt domain-containing protein [Entamoeba marina]